MFIYQMLFAKCYSRCLRYSDNTKPLPVWRLHSGGEAQQWSINQITICQIKINMVKKNREMNQHRLRRSFYLFCLTFNFILDYSQWTVLCSFRWIAKGFSYTYTCIHSPPNSRGGHFKGHGQLLLGLSAKIEPKGSGQVVDTGGESWMRWRLICGRVWEEGEQHIQKPWDRIKPRFLEKQKGRWFALSGRIIGMRED